MVASKYKSNVIASALINKVLPKLADLIDEAGEWVAEYTYEEDANLFDIEQGQQAVMFALADLLLLTTNDHSEDHIYPPLRPDQLRNTEYAVEFFELEHEDMFVTVPDDDPPQPPANVITPSFTPDKQDVSAHARVKEIYQVSRDTDLTEESIAQAVIYPPIRDALDKYSRELADMYSPVAQNEQGEPVCDLEQGAKSARRALMVSLLSWMQTDPALADDGTEIGLLA